MLVAIRSAFTGMSKMLALSNPLNAMAPTLAPSAMTPTMAQVCAPTTSLMRILYIHVIPYVPKAWHQALLNAKLLDAVPNLVHDLNYGSPISNPPPLLELSLPGNLPSANIHPQIIDVELLAEVAVG